MIQLMNVGYGNTANISRIISVLNPDSAPIKRMVQNAKEDGRLIDATQGRKVRSIIVMDSGHVIKSSIQPETLASRLSPKNIHKHATFMAEEAEE